MADRSFLDWPFFEPRHRELAAALDQWCAANLPVDHADVDAACIGLVRMLGDGGWLQHSAIDPDNPGTLDVRSLCLVRETLARHDGLADFAFAMQGLGTGAISLFGSARTTPVAEEVSRRRGANGIRTVRAALRI
jgi:acyl-CoA dehydrogenase